MPNGEEFQEVIDSASEDSNNEYAKDSENESEDSSSSNEEVDSSLRSERHSK